jgi:hypothetical protein
MSESKVKIKKTKKDKGFLRPYKRTLRKKILFIAYIAIERDGMFVTQVKPCD